MMIRSEKAEAAKVLRKEAEGMIEYMTTLLKQGKEIRGTVVPYTHSLLYIADYLDRMVEK